MISMDIPGHDLIKVYKIRNKFMLEFEYVKIEWSKKNSKYFMRIIMIVSHFVFIKQYKMVVRDDNIDYDCKFLVTNGDKYVS